MKWLANNLKIDKQDAAKTVDVLGEDRNEKRHGF